CCLQEQREELCQLAIYSLVLETRTEAIHRERRFGLASEDYPFQHSHRPWRRRGQGRKMLRVSLARAYPLPVLRSPPQGHSKPIKIVAKPISRGTSPRGSDARAP